MPCEPLCRRYSGLAPRASNLSHVDQKSARKRTRRVLIKLTKFIQLKLPCQALPTLLRLIVVVAFLAFAACFIFHFVSRWDGQREIHDSCGVPWSLLQVIHRASILTKPGITDDPTALIKAIACKVDAVNGIMVVEPMNGLANRLRTLASAAALARRHGRHLLVLWRADAHCGAPFRVLFELPQDSVIVAVFDTTAAVAELIKTDFGDNSGDDAWHKWTVLDAMQKTLALRQHATNLNMKDERRHLYVRSSSVLNPKPGIRWHVINAELARFRPAVSVRDRVASLKARLNRSVCMHVRHVPLSDDVAGVAENEYGAIDAAVTAFWRNMSAPSVFAAEAARLMDGDVYFHEVFVAADRSEWIHDVRVKLAGIANVWSLADTSGANIQQNGHTCELRNEHCVGDALVDMLCLSHCALFIGSPWSSFTEVAARLRGERTRLAGIDFSRVTPASLGGISSAVRHAILQTMSAKTKRFKHWKKNMRVENMSDTDVEVWR